MTSSQVSTLVDAVGIRRRGGLVVLTECVEALVAHPSLGTPDVCVDRPDVRRALEPFGGAIRLHTVAETTPRRLVWVAGGAGRRARRSGADVVLHLANYGFVARGLPNAILVHQPNPFWAEAALRWRWRDRVRFALMRQLIARAARRAHGVMVQTDEMARAVRDLAGIAPEKVRVFLPSVAKDLPSQVEDQRGDGGIRDGERPFTAVYVGSDHAHKNVHAVQEASAILQAAGSDVRVVATVPAQGWPASETFSPVGHVDRGRALGLIESADVLVMPSFVETVGLPMLEAMRLGTAVLAADRPYARAVCRDAARYFEPTDAASLAEAIEALQDDPAAVASLVDRGRARLAEIDASDPYRSMMDYLVSLAAGT